MAQGQTPKQRAANAKYQSSQEAKMGSYRPPKADRETRKKMGFADKFKQSPIHPGWVIGILVLLLGGIFVEMLRLFF